MTQGYASPELLGLLPPTDMAYTNEIDIWALGCIVHEMLTGEIPFLDNPQYFDSQLSLASEPDDAQMPQTDVIALKAFCDGSIAFPTDRMRRSGVSDAAEECVKSMLVVIPKFRVTAQDALQSEWLLPDGYLDAGAQPNAEQSRRNHMLVFSRPFLSFPPSMFG